MRVLLDTHALLWSLEGNGRLSSTARELIENEGNEVLVSVVSAWEMNVKRALGKLTAPYATLTATAYRPCRRFIATLSIGCSSVRLWKMAYPSSRRTS